MNISTGNSKTGPSWSILEIASCPYATELCKSLCYAKIGRMALHSTRRGKNFKETIQLIQQGLFVEKFLELWDKTFKLPKNKFRKVYTGTLRIHDAGDFFNIQYILAWIEIAKRLPEVKFWAYTRSWRGQNLLPYLHELAGLDNVSIWISVDNQNYLEAINCFRQNKNFAGIALMATENDQDLIEYFTDNLNKSNLVVFPTHGYFGRLTGKVLNRSRKSKRSVPNCPAIIGKVQYIKGQTKAECL